MEYCSLIRIFDFVEDRLHLGNTKKNEFSFGISLDLHYLCTQNRKKETIMEARTTSNTTGRMARVISAKVRLSGRTDKPKSEILTIEEFKRRAEIDKLFEEK